MMGTEIAAVFLKCRIQPVMSRAHPMWLYSGPMDETRVNIAELSEKELLDEVRRLTSQEDKFHLFLFKNLLILIINLFIILFASDIRLSPFFKSLFKLTGPVNCRMFPECIGWQP
jgi:hypothetical protein